MSTASWKNLPTELHIAIVQLLPPDAIVTLSVTSSASHSLCVPEIFADVNLSSASSLRSFVHHVPRHYGAYVKSLAVCTKQARTTPSELTCTDALVTLLESCTRLQSLSLSLAMSLGAEKLIPVFTNLSNLHTFKISCWGREDEAPVSERLAVSLAASLPSLSHLTLSRITRSAFHVDPCDVPYDVPIVMNDFDIPAHPILGSDLALPSLLRLPSLQTVEICDTWLGCDTKIDLDGASTTHPALQKLVLTGSMYSSDAQRERQACTAWLRACGPSLGSFELGTSLAMPQETTPLATRETARLTPLQLPHISHIHINASRILADDLSSTLDVLSPCAVESISITYEDENTGPESAPRKSASEEEFARECALDDLQDWKMVIEPFLLNRSKAQWDALRRVSVSLAKDVQASWDL
ncbi:hypothetical protein PAXRUDRAFT_827888 [Paxillus rubicundulus Ve08.2h10]|uniref:F-box domain-containing protein n=1 Tax=Paxillus rubicundulus Ve08.2h10 TaxID=930991 RepID=A0A0D0DX16_9AGAM|nr:hypothetical protein PAXRUDRAFT_827888 [Paxillus rubicundulus Ve08.2h10]